MRTRLTLFNVFFLLFLGQMVVAQVTGTINDGDKFPVYDAEVLVKGTEKKTFTDEEGKFSIDAKVGDVLVVTGPDMTVAEYAVSKPNLGVLKLGEIVQLKETVVIGYGITETNEQKTGAYSTLGTEAIEAVSAASFDQALQGQVAGVVVGASSGQPGAGAPIFIRGITSLTGSTQPLVVINGVPVLGEMGNPIASSAATTNPLSSIDPSTIENITILKDAQATSLYGARGANGVILVTLKKGLKNQSKFTFLTERGFARVSKEKDDWLSAQGHANYVAMGLHNWNKVRFPTFADAYKYNFMDWDGTTNADWKKATRANSPWSEKYAINYQGGSDNVRVFSSLNYFKQQGVSRKADFERMSGYLNTEWDANEKLSVGFDVNLSSTEQNGPTDGSAFSNPVFAGNIMSPTQRIYNEDGSYNLDLNFLGSDMNPVAIQNTNVDETKIYKVLSTVNASYKVLPYLTFDSRFGVDFTMYDQLLWWNPDFGDGYSPGNANGNGYGRKGDMNFLSWTWTNSLNFNKTFADFHRLSATLATEYLDSKENYSIHTARGYPGGGRLPGLTNAANPTESTSYEYGYSFASYVARVAYSYDNRYMVSANYRRDGSSRFPKENRWGDFWGAGVSWNVGNEAFLKESSVISSLKVRASYGEVGNAEIGNYAYRDLYQASYGSYLKNPAGGITQVGNDELKWETVKQIDVGIDYGFLKNRITGSFDYYQKKSTDLLYKTPINASSGGFTSRWDNMGDVKSTGFEAVINGTPIRTDDFSWTISANYAYNDTKVKRLNDNNVKRINGHKAFAVGHNPTEFYTYLWAGVNQKDGTPLWYTDGYGSETTGERSKAKMGFTGKQALPVHTAGLTNTITYKGFKLSALFTYAGGHSVYDTWGFVYNGDGAYLNLNTREEWVKNSWTPGSTDAKYPQIIYGGNSQSNGASTRYLYDADHIRLRSLELGYRFDKKILGEKSLIDGIYIYVKGNNLYTWVFDKDLYFDPEVSSSDRGTATAPISVLENMGMYDQTAPNMKQYLFGMVIEF